LPVARGRAAAVDSGHAWVVAVTVAATAALGFGIAYSFGAFFDEMAADLHASRGTTASVFAVTTFLFFGVGIVSGPLCDRYGPRRLLRAAACTMGAGLVLTSLVQAVWVGYLTYGLGVGLGAGLYITPSFAVVGGWFERQRALALGVASAGSGLGTLLLVPTANRLIEAFGWRGAYVTLGVLAFVVLMIASFLVERPPVPPPAPGDQLLRAAASTPAFRLLFVSGLFMSIALFSAFAFIVPFAEDHGISSGAAALLLSMVGAASVAGRVAMSGLTRRLGPLRLYQLCLAVQPVAYLVWLGAGGRYGALTVFAVLLGISYGGYVALGPTVAAHLFGVIGLGGLLGVLWFGSAVGGLVGPPLSGALADGSGGQRATILLALVATILATVLTFAVPDRPAVPDRVGLPIGAAPPAGNTPPSGKPPSGNAPPAVEAAASTAPAGELTEVDAAARRSARPLR
jgi:MFS family permease